MAEQKGEFFSERQKQELRWKQFCEHLERTYGKGTFFSKEWLRKHFASGIERTLTGSSSPIERTLTGSSSPIERTLTGSSSPTERTPTGSSSIASQNSPPDSLTSIRDAIGNCTRCGLCEKRKNIVFGEGLASAKLMFIGEGPGEQEDLQGRPFVGPAGQLLDKIIEAMGLKRADVYIANVVKCRPPGNRVPTDDEAKTCEQFLFRQIEVIAPTVLVALGGTALKCLLHDENARISSMRGKFIEFRGRKLMPTFHPAYLLRNPESKKVVWEDMKKVMHQMGLI